MVRLFASKLKLLVIAFTAIVYVAFAIAFPQITISATPIGAIYDGEKKVADVTSLGVSLGSGGIGNIRVVNIANGRGDESHFAMKSFKDNVSESGRQKFIARWKRFSTIFENDHEGVLAYAKPGLKLVFNDPKYGPPQDIILSEIAGGSIFDHMAKVELKPKDPQLEAKLSVVMKAKRLGLKAIRLLASEGFVHGDVKLSNFLYYPSEKGFDWDHPEISRVRFKLWDFDMAVPIHQDLIYVDDTFITPPEIWLKKTTKASPAFDIYAHAVTMYSMAFNNNPVYDYVTSPEGRYLQEAAFKKMPDEAQFRAHGMDLIKRDLYTNYFEYGKYLRWIERKFNTLDRPGLSKGARLQLSELRNFVVNGLKHSPEERLDAFPSIRAHVAVSACPGLIGELRAAFAK